MKNMGSDLKSPFSSTLSRRARKSSIIASYGYNSKDTQQLPLQVTCSVGFLTPHNSSNINFNLFSLFSNF